MASDDAARKKALRGVPRWWSKPEEERRKKLASGPKYSKEEPIVGTWEYEYQGKLWRRTYSVNGYATLERQNPDSGEFETDTWDGKPWVYDYHIIDGNTVIVTTDDGREHLHEILENGKMNIEGRFIATKLTNTEADAVTH
jgi:hypothetical protein